MLRIDTAICRVGDMHSENSEFHTVFFLYCSRDERSVKCVRPALEMEASKEEQRGVVRFLLAESAWTRDKVKMPWNDVGRMIRPVPILPIWWGITCRDLVGKHFNILRTAQIFLLDFHIFGDLKKTFVDVGFIRIRKCKSGWRCGSISDLPLSTKLGEFSNRLAVSLYKHVSLQINVQLTLSVICIETKT